MKILVTGGAGFIGKNLCATLLAQGHTVVAVDNFITGNKTGLSRLRAHKNFTFIKHDIVRPLPPLLRGKQFQQIYHLACPTGVPNVTKLAEEMLLTSSIGTKHILDFALANDARVVFTSSSEAYGNPLVSPQPETYTGNVDPIGLRSPYEEGKRFSEALIASYVRKYSLGAMIVRLFNTYGPGMDLTETRVIPRFIKHAIDASAITVQGTGRQTRTFCYVDDLVSALSLVMHKGRKGEVYNLGNAKETRIIDLAKQIITLTKSKSKIIFIRRPTHDHDRRHPALSKIKALGWRPTTSLSRGLTLTIKSYL